MLERLRHEALPLQDDLVAVQVDADHLRPRVPQGVVPETRHRQAALADAGGLPRHLDQNRVEHVADVAVDVVAEGADADTDLRCGDAGAAGDGDGVQKILDERAHPVVDRVDRRAHGTQHRVAEDADGSYGHAQAADARERSPSTTVAAISRAACRVSG